MKPLNEYIAGQRDKLGRRELNRIIDQYEWFTIARRARALMTGENDSALTLPLDFWATVPPAMQTKDELEPGPRIEPAANSDAIIDRFLEHGGYRIVPAGEGSVEANIPADCSGELDADLATEDLAEIYLSQGLAGQAKEIYRRLSLRNPQKSIYFADIISRIDAKPTPETTNN